jgi:hypothetical protein
VGAAVRRRSQRASGSAAAASESPSRCPAVCGEEHVEGALRALGDGELGRPVVVVGRRLGVERLLTAVEHEEGEGEVRLARGLEAAHKVDAPLAQVRPSLLDEWPHRAAAEGQLGEARVGVRHVRQLRRASK